ncbi:PsbP-related protein [Paenibacillus eucommiae]|uniref:Tfp pilus assembly protein, major pilin PilA n=1 Tax=Paenibacillus eucommiae TaxID=1355755 RepID=A0ABS4IQT6_9BACL|nr:PsbP-related protein [Paenibacillus eucommiae]MBP1989937.1 hypothetical protein [Paenibacillus eucommiae]
MNTPKHLGKILITGMASLLIFTGCSPKNEATNGASSSPGSQATSETKPEFKGKTLTAPDGNFEITVPKEWKDDAALKQLAKISASNRGKEQYIMINEVSKNDYSDGAALEDFKNTFISGTAVSLKNYKEDEVSEITIDAVPATQLIFSGEAENIKVKYIVALLEKGNSFYQLVTWSTESKFEANLSTFEQVLHTFKVLKETSAEETAGTTAPSAAPSANSNEPKVMKSKDGKLELTVLGDWKEANLNEEADLQGAKLSSEDYFIIMKEEKDLFADDMKLAEYNKIIADNMSAGLQNATVSEPVSLEVNGQPALQSEITGEVDKIKIAYLLTTVQSSKHFSQVLFWTQQKLMAEKKQGYMDATKTFKIIE